MENNDEDLNALKEQFRKVDEERLKKKKADSDLKSFLKQSADELTRKKESDEYLERKFVEVELANGMKFNLNELHDYITTLQEYRVRFKQNFYRQVFRLNGWKIPPTGTIWHKPSIVGRYTIDIIYGRFPKEIFPALQAKNYFQGIRLHKYFQFLTPQGQIELEKFIDEAVKIMERCSTWDEFVNEHAKAYGFPFQKSLFEA